MVSYSEYLFKTLTKDDFVTFFKNHLKISFTKSNAIYNFIHLNPHVTFDQLININGVGPKTVNKIKNFEPNFANIRTSTPEITIKPINIILDAVLSISENNKTLKQIYAAVSTIVGGSNINLLTLKPYTNKDGTLLNLNNARLRQEGSIRSLIEENSSDSRQYYTRGNILYTNGLPTSKNLFSNEALQVCNELKLWKIEFDENLVFPKRTGIWKLSPGQGSPTPEQFIDMETELINRPKGFRRQGNRQYRIVKNVLSRFFISTKLK